MFCLISTMHPVRPGIGRGGGGIRAIEVDRSYEAYDNLPLDTEDEWGNPADFLDAVGSA